MQMCQGCEDFAEYDRAIDAYIAKVLPAMIDRALDADILRGPSTQGE